MAKDSEGPQTAAGIQRGRQSSEAYKHRLKRMRDQGLKPPIAQHGDTDADRMASQAVLDCGWGRLVFAQTFEESGAMISALRGEQPDRRDIAVYVRNPHVLLANAPQELFLDPSHTFRLDLSRYRASRKSAEGVLHPPVDVPVRRRGDQSHLFGPRDDPRPAGILLGQA